MRRLAMPICLVVSRSLEVSWLPRLRTHASNEAIPCRRGLSFVRTADSAGSRWSRHHLTPKLKGGARLGTVGLHQICHSAIHARYTEAEIARRLNDIGSLREDPEIARFVAWVRTKPDDFHAPTRTTRGKAGPRRRAPNG